MTIEPSPFPGVSPSVFADSACPIISATCRRRLSPSRLIAWLRFSLPLDQNPPRLIGRVAAERLMRSQLVVNIAQHVQRGLQCDVVRDPTRP